MTEAGRSPRGSYAKGVTRRAEILRVALDVVAENGIRSASTREIARRAGLTHAGLTHYFRTREELYMEVLRARDARDLAERWETTSDINGFLAIINANTQVPGLVQLFVEFAAEASLGKHPAHEFFVERTAGVRQLIAGCVVAAQEAGEFGPYADPDAVAQILIAVSDGLQQLWLLDRSVDMVGQIRRVWAGLRATSFLADSAEGAESPEGADGAQRGAAIAELSDAASRNQ